MEKKQNSCREGAEKMSIDCINPNAVTWKSICEKKRRLEKAHDIENQFAVQRQMIVNETEKGSRVKDFR